LSSRTDDLPNPHDRRRDKPRGLSATWAGLRGPIVFDGTSSPVKKALFFIICAAWILPGLIGHAPWKPDEAVTFGVIHSMLTDGTWLTPSVAGDANFDYPPLYHWVAALCAMLLGWAMPLHDAARLATGLLMAVTLMYVHKTATRLFDERAGRIAVLLAIGCLGLLVRAHQMQPEIAGLAGMAVALYGMTRIRSEPRKGGITTGVGAAIIGLAIGIVPALMVPAIAIALIVFVGETRNRDFRRGILISLAVMVPLLALYPIALAMQGTIPDRMWTDVIMGAPFLNADTRGAIQPAYFLQTLVWYAMPAWPFALWLWWRDRAKLRERIELALPLVTFVTMLVWLSFTREARDTTALVMLLPLSLAAASALDRLPREVASFMDWFGLVFFGLAAFALWFYWTAAISGFPDAAARAVARQVADFQFSFHIVSFGLAALLTLVWLYAMVRAHRSNRRAVVNWAAGITIIWVLANLLGQPAVDHVLSHRNVVTSINQQLPSLRTCVAGFGLGEAEHAAFDYFAKLRFVALYEERAKTCEWLVTYGSRQYPPTVDQAWQRVWEGGRPRDKDEVFRLYRR
jgi:4-amino-4-deoxy-L-arabinose transferase-like glycosyltransferase